MCSPDSPAFQTSFYAARQENLPGVLRQQFMLRLAYYGGMCYLYRRLMNTSLEKTLVMVREEELPILPAPEMVSLLAGELAAFAGFDAVAVEASACMREESESTYVGRGMAVPHARVAGLSRAAVYVARSRTGISWGEGVAHLVVFTAAPEEHPELYLQMLAAATRWRMRFPGGEEALLAASPAELLSGLQAVFA